MIDTNPDIFVHQYKVVDGQKLPIADPKTSNSKNEYTWQHIDLTKPDACQWIENSASLEHTVINALTANESRPRATKLKNGVLVVLRGVNLNPGNDPEDMVSIRVWLEKNRVISARRRLLMSVQDIVEDMTDGEGPTSSGEFLIEVIGKLANRIGAFVNQIDEELSDIEDQLEEIEASSFRATLGSLRRQIAGVRRYLSPQRDALDRLNYFDSELFTEKDKQRIRDESDRVARYLEDLDLARERAIVLQEAFMSQIAQQQNNRMYVLSIITMIFLPLGFLTGLLGINIGGMPGAENPKAFWIFVVMLVGVIGVQGLILRKIKWI